MVQVLLGGAVDKTFEVVSFDRLVVFMIVGPTFFTVRSRILMIAV